MSLPAGDQRRCRGCGWMETELPKSRRLGDRYWAEVDLCSSCDPVSSDWAPPRGIARPLVLAQPAGLATVIPITRGHAHKR